MSATILPPALALGPFRTATALDAGLTPRQLQSRRFVRLFRDVHVLEELAHDPVVRARGALLLAPHAVIGRASAARLWSLPVPDPPAEGAEPVHLVVAPGEASPRRAGLVIHEAVVPATDVERRHDLPLTVPARVMLDVAPCWAMGDLVALGDEALARRVLCERDLAARIRDASGRRGVATARHAMTLLDPESPSPSDSRTRVLLHFAGLPRGRHLGPGLLGWPEYHVRLDVSGGSELPSDLVVRAWDLLRAHGWRPDRSRPLLHEALAAIGAFRTRAPSWGYPA